MPGTTSPTGLSDIRRAVARHKIRSVLTFLVVLIVAVAASFLVPKAFHSESKLLVRLGKENATLDPTVTMSQDTVVAVPASRDNELNSVAEVLKSRNIAEKVVDVLGAEFILAKAPKLGGSESSSEQTKLQQVVDRFASVLARGKALLKQLDGSPTIGSRDLAISELLSQYTVTPGRRSDVLQIDCKGPTPQWAQKVLTTLVDVYVDEYIQLNRPNRHLDFFTAQADRTKRELLVKQEELRDLKTMTEMVAVPEQRVTLSGRVNRLQEDFLQWDTACKAAQSRIDALQKELAELPAEEIETATSGIGNEGSDLMRSQLYQLEVKKEEAAAKYTSDHPALKAIDDQLRTSRALASSQDATRTHVVKGRNRLYQETQLALLQEQPIMASAIAKREAAREQLVALHADLKKFNEYDLQIAGLEREVELRQTAYRKYASGMEQTKIDQALITQRISNIGIAEPATFEPEAVFPRKSYFMAAGVLAGILASVVVALWADARDHSLRSPEDVERRLGLEVLGTIPRFSSRHSVAGNGGRR